MNHCVTPGCGKRCRKGDRIHCQKCLYARTLRDWRFVTPAMRRWRAELARRARKEGGG